MENTTTKKARRLCDCVRKQVTVKKFIELVCKELKFEINWKGKGLKEVGYINKKKIIKINKKYFRPTEVDNLLGNASYAKKKLNWKPKHNLITLIKDMVSEELK